MFVPPSLPLLLPTYQPTYRHLFHEPRPCLGHKDEKGAVPALSSYCQKDRTTMHTNYNTVYGWNGVCQMDKERRGFSNESQHPVQGQGGGSPVPVNKYFLSACYVPHTVS